MSRYGACSYCKYVMTIPYGVSSVRCPQCHAVYGITDTKGRGEMFGPLGHSGEGWWLLGGFLLGAVVGSATGRALLVSALGLTQQEIRRKVKKATKELEKRRKRLE